MKLRIKSNSVRYRLTRSDVRQLEENGLLKDSTDFGNGVLRYAIQKYSGENLLASFSDGEVALQMPSAMIEALADTDRVGFENMQGKLHLLVEKDFSCLENVSEDQSDNYPNPLRQNDEKAD